MAPTEAHQITLLLQRVQQGDPQALAEIAQVMHGELRQIAGEFLRRQPAGHTWQPTDLVNELWTRLLARDQLRFENRSHFLGVAAHLMRSLIIDHARARLARKRSTGDATPPPGGPLVLLARISDCDLAELLALDTALEGLAQFRPRQAQIVELRYFAGLTIEEAAQALDLSPMTVKREWAAARAWLHAELRSLPQ